MCVCHLWKMWGQEFVFAVDIEVTCSLKELIMCIELCAGVNCMAHVMGRRLLGLCHRNGHLTIEAPFSQ